MLSGAQLKMQLCQRQSAPQLCAPLSPQASLSPGAHSPCSLHGDQSDQRPELPSQLRLCVPQLPQACVAGPLQT